MSASQRFPSGVQIVTSDLFYSNPLSLRSDFRSSPGNVVAVGRCYANGVAAAQLLGRLCKVASSLASDRAKTRSAFGKLNSSAEPPAHTCRRKNLFSETLPGKYLVADVRSGTIGGKH